MNNNFKLGGYNVPLFRTISQLSVDSKLKSIKQNTYVFKRTKAYEDIEHLCSLPENANLLHNRLKGFWRKWLYSFLIISNKHPQTPNYFRSISLQRNQIKQQVFNPFWFFIHPFSKLRLYFDIIMAPLSLLTIFIIIFIIGFYDELYKWSSDTELIAILCAINIICIMDIFLNLFTGYYDGVEVIFNPINIANHYLKGYFIVDSITVFTFIYLMSTIKKNSLAHVVFKNLLLIKVLTIPRCFKRLATTLEFFRASDIVQRIVRLFVNTLVLTHISGCIYKKSYQYFFTKGEWSETDFLFDDSLTPIKKYELIIYIITWRIFANSFGNHTPTSKLAQKFVGFLSMLVGSFFQIHLIIQILHIMEIQNTPCRKYQEIVSQLKAYMMTKKFPVKLQERLKYFYYKKFNKSFFQETLILEALSKPLRFEIMIHRGRLFVDKVMLFHGSPKPIIKSIVSCLKLNVFLPNDMIVKAGAYGNCMYFIGLGTVAVTTKSGKEICHLYDGDHFGEFALVLRDCMRKANVTAIDYCEVYQLDKVDFKKNVHQSSELFNRIEKLALRRLDLLLIEEERQRNEINLNLTNDYPTYSL